MLRKIQEAVIEYNSSCLDKKYKIIVDLGVKIGSIYVESNKHYDFFCLDNEMEECYKFIKKIIEEYKEEFDDYL